MAISSSARWICRPRSRWRSEFRSQSAGGQRQYRRGCTWTGAWALAGRTVRAGIAPPRRAALGESRAGAAHCEACRARRERRASHRGIPAGVAGDRRKHGRRPHGGELVFLRHGDGLIARSRIRLTDANAAEMLPGDGLISGRFAFDLSAENRNEADLVGLSPRVAAWSALPRSLERGLRSSGARAAGCEWRSGCRSCCTWQSPVRGGGGGTWGRAVPRGGAGPASSSSGCCRCSSRSRWRPRSCSRWATPSVLAGNAAEAGALALPAVAIHARARARLCRAGPRARACVGVGRRGEGGAPPAVPAASARGQPRGLRERGRWIAP